ncbi:SPX domain-containing protein [Mycena crocata]|nr:SPX domain-containing protein [Mycena crocata]
MKFSSSLKFNAVAEWWDEYIAYDALKKYIYQLEKTQHEQHTTYRDHETTPLVGGDSNATGLTADAAAADAVFIPLLDRELKKICAFYEAQQSTLVAEVAELQELVRAQDEAAAAGDSHYLDGPYGDELDGEDADEEDDDDDSLSRSPQRRRRRLSSSAGQGRLPLSASRRGIPEEHSPSARYGGGHRHSISSGSSDGHPSPTSPTTHLPHRTPLSAGGALGRLANKLTPDFLSSSRHSADLMHDSVHSADLLHSSAPLHSSLQFGAAHHDTSAHSGGGLLGNIRNSILSDSSHSHGLQDVWTARTDYATDTRLLFKRRITTLYISVTSLASYVEVNWSGFRKILKKYDKVTFRSLKDSYLHSAVAPSPPFSPAAKSTLASLTNRLIDAYAKCVCRGDRALAKQQLRLHQRENIAWERDTVWRQMIGRERRGEGGGVLAREGSDESDDGFGFRKLVAEGGDAKRKKKGLLRITRRRVAMAGALGVFVALLNTQMVEGREANRCFAVLMFCTVLWATEAIPLFVTSLMVPLLLVCFGVVRDGEGTPLPPPDATKYIFSVMFSPTIMLLIGGFTISSALSKTAIDRVLITRVLSLAGTRPSTVLLAFMGVSCFASMWISNVAAPTLCFTLIRPILRTLPPKSSFGPCLILAIALAANIGGQSSPISSPQNLIALQAMDPPIGWAQWFAVALPVSFVSILLIWGLLLVSYHPARSPDGGRDIEIRLIRPTREPFTLKQWWVSAVCVVTIALWCVARQIEDVVGDMGIIAIIPIVAFFATGVLKKDDFEQFAWTIVFLAMGGIALGKGVTSSGLLEVLDLLIRDLLDGVSLYNVVLILSPVVLVISTFVSHTIASVLLVPIAKEVGSNLPGNHQNLLIFVTGLICSAGMGMPVSGFPNQTAATQEDELGVLYLSNVDFLKNGVPASVIATLVVATIGFLLMKAIGL